MHCGLWFTCTSQIPLMFCWDRVERVCCLLPWTWWEQRLVMSLGNIVLCHLGSASGYLLSFFTISYQALFCKCRFHVLHHLTYLYYDGMLHSSVSLEVAKEYTVYCLHIHLIWEISKKERYRQIGNIRSGPSEICSTRHQDQYYRRAKGWAQWGIWI